MTDTVLLAAVFLPLVAAVVVFASRLPARMRVPAPALFKFPGASSGGHHDTNHPGEYR
jgi:hypothetical protein